MPADGPTERACRSSVWHSTADAFAAGAEADADADADEAATYLSAMRNAANFAFGNRLFLALMAVRAMSEVIGRTIEARLIYDAPHNLVWERGEDRYLHRKGATPAPGPDPFESPFSFTGHPVIIPGSMGDASWVLARLGNDDLHA